MLSEIKNHQRLQLRKLSSGTKIQRIGEFLHDATNVMYKLGIPLVVQLPIICPDNCVMGHM